MENESFTSSPVRSRLLAALGLLGFIATGLLLCFLVGRPLLRFAGDTEQFRRWVDASGLWGRVLFLAMVAVQLVLAFLPGEPFEVAAGYAFGFAEGTALCLLGSLLGGAAVFLAVRRYGTRFVNLLFPGSKLSELSILKDPKKRDPLMLLLYLLPGTPKDLITYFAGLTDIKFSKFLIISTLARIPSVVTSTAGGSAMGENSYLLALIAFGAAALLAAIGAAVYRRITGK